jgi:hypothetical protein
MSDANHPPEASVESVLSEDDFLRLQAEKAKAEITESLQRAKAALKNNADPRELTRRHPWLAIGSAAVVGFAAAVAAIPSKEEQELRRLERIRRAMNPEPAPPKATGAETNGQDAKAVAKPTFVQTLLHELIQILKPILMTAITASIKSGVHPAPANPPPASPPPDTNGNGGSGPVTPT